MHASVRSLALAASAGLLLSLLPALPAAAHGLSAVGLVAGALHPLSGADHLLLLLGVGALVAGVDRRLLWPALIGAILGSLFGAAGGLIPSAERLAALSVSALGLVLLAARPLRQAQGGQALIGAVVGGAVALHALLHGREASADPLWWIGAALAAAAVVALSTAVFSRCQPSILRTTAMALGLSGLVLAVVPLG